MSLYVKQSVMEEALKGGLILNLKKQLLGCQLIKRLNTFKV